MENSYNDTRMPEQTGFDAKQVAYKYLARWKWFLAALVCSVAAGLVYISSVVPEYKIEARMLFKDESKNVNTSASILEGLDIFMPKRAVENEMEILHSRTLTERVVRDLNLQVKYLVKRGLRKQELYGKTSPIDVRLTEDMPDRLFEVKVSRDGQLTVEGKNCAPGAVQAGGGTVVIVVKDSLPADWDFSQAITVDVSPEDNAVDAMLKNLQVRIASKGSTVINLSLLSTVPQRGQDALDYLMKVYDLASVDDKNALAGITLKFIDERLQLVADSLYHAEKVVENYKSAEGIADIGIEADIFLRSLRENDVELNKINIQIEVLDGVRQYVSRPAGDNGAVPATFGIDDPSILSLITALTTREGERIKALASVGPANPIIIALDQQIADLKDQVQKNVAILNRSLLVSQKQLREENRRLEKEIYTLPRKERQLMDVVRQQEIKNELYLYLLSKREETAISYAATISDSRLIDRARSSVFPVKPVKRNIMVIFVLLGFLVTLAGIWIADLIHSEIRTKDDVERRTKVPVVGEIPLLKKAARIIDLSTSKGRAAEQFRTLRTNLEFMKTSMEGPHTILVTSNVSAEGKSFIAANLGAAYAALGKRAVVLGFDLRNPGLHKVFGIENKAGLSSYITGQAELKDIIIKSDEIQNLDLINCGYLPPNPQELLLSQAVTRLFAELRAMYDYIIVDTAPAGLVSDALILGAQAEISLWVVRQGVTPKESFKLLNALHAGGRLPNIGIVINGIRSDRWYGYGYYGTYGADKYHGKYYNQAED